MFLDAEPEDGAALVIGLQGAQALKALALVFQQPEPVRIALGSFVTVRSVATPEREGVDSAD